MQARIEAACRAAGRDPSEVRLVAVSKTFPAAVVAAAADAGQLAFGENYLQDALPKMDELEDRELEWHFIGQLQSNKTREVAARFSWVQSVDRLKIARRLSEQRRAHGPALNLCLQVSLDGEAGRGGLRPEDAPSLAAAVAELPRLKLRGLMVVPPAGASDEELREAFSRVRTLRDDLVDAGHDLDTLSMGMSGDLEQAITCGSTLVRVGTSVFGER